MRQLFVIAWPFCFLFVDWVWWRESKVLRFENLRARILYGLASPLRGASRRGCALDREGL